MLIYNALHHELLGEVKGKKEREFAVKTRSEAPAFRALINRDLRKLTCRITFHAARVSRTWSSSG